jgi:hypothetical protein
LGWSCWKLFLAPDACIMYVGVRRSRTLETNCTEEYLRSPFTGRMARLAALPLTGDYWASLRDVDMNQVVVIMQLAATLSLHYLVGNKVCWSIQASFRSERYS